MNSAWVSVKRLQRRGSPSLPQAPAAAWPHVEQTAGLLTSRNSPHQLAHSSLRFHTFRIYSCSKCSWRRSTLLSDSLAGNYGTQGHVCRTFWRHAFVLPCNRVEMFLPAQTWPCGYYFTVLGRWLFLLLIRVLIWFRVSTFWRKQFVPKTSQGVFGIRPGVFKNVGIKGGSSVSRFLLDAFSLTVSGRTLMMKKRVQV